MKYEQKVQVETQEYVCLVKRIDGVVAQKILVKELIRCEKCKFAKTDATCFLVCTREGMGLKPFHVRDDDFCSYGKRREE